MVVVLAARSAVGWVFAATVLAGCSVAPTPLTQEEVREFTNRQLPLIAGRNEPISAKIDLYEALARALKFNLDHRVEMMAVALSMRELDQANADMLPRLVANSVYAGRSNVAASSSQSILTGRQSLEPSTSTDRNTLAADLTFGWNILDFGLSYVRAKQQADKALITEEQRRKAAQRILEDTRTAYWRAISADRLVRETRALEGSVRTALANARALVARGEAPPLPALNYERELIVIRRELQELERNLSVSRAQLAALISVQPDTPFELEVPERPPVPPAPQWQPEEMIRLALENRSEIRQVMYEMRINRSEADAAILSLLPGISIYGGINADTNRYLFNSNWVAWGARASWNLLSIFTYPARRATISAKDELLKERSLAIMLAVMTQVHVSRARVAANADGYRVASELLDVQTRILRQTQAEAAADFTGEQSVIRERMNLLAARARQDVAYAELQNAHANLLASLGFDPIGIDIALNRPVAEVARDIRAALAGRDY